MNRFTYLSSYRWQLCNQNANTMAQGLPTPIQVLRDLHPTRAPEGGIEVLYTCIFLLLFLDSSYVCLSCTKVYVCVYIVVYSWSIEMNDRQREYIYICAGINIYRSIHPTVHIKHISMPFGFFYFFLWQENFHLDSPKGVPDFPLFFHGPYITLLILPLHFLSLSLPGFHILSSLLRSFGSIINLAPSKSLTTLPRSLYI